ncbi:DUF5818 domain-containing protein [Occallatibacter riparius]|uniref:DUF5818 domain-containing protein n=1 Tax=Occallatibacter riparius TaxID=1002689 RepID=A0A9J7BP34_9BACT|nr:DUF5818 domain-containing protein [Occallatibacter riparius]UWZ84289.1 DUF5818 domain-containing protein [Occallatibacter riparius]
MKSGIKRSLFVGISMALVALTVRRYNRDSEINAGPDGPSGGSGGNDKIDHSSVTGPVLADQPVPIAIRRPAMVAPTVTFSGTVVRSGPRFALRETAGVLYPLDSAGRAWPFEGEDVRVTGKLDLDTRLLYVDAIEPVDGILGGSSLPISAA